jgi:hypothetical protein
VARAGCNPRPRPRAVGQAGCNRRLPAHAVGQADCNRRRPALAVAPTGCNLRYRGRAVGPAGCNRRRRAHCEAPLGCNLRYRGRAAGPAGCNRRRRAPCAAPLGCNLRYRGHAAGPAGCNPRPRALGLAAHSSRCPGRAGARAGCSPRRRGRAAGPAAVRSPSRPVHAVGSAGCSSRYPGRVAGRAGCSSRRRGRAAGLAVVRSPSRPVHAVASPYGSRSSHGLPSLFPPQAAVVVPWSGDLPPRRPRRSPEYAAALQDAHTRSCRLAGLYPSPGGNQSAGPPVPRHRKSAAAGTAAPRLPDGHRGSHHPDARARTLTPVPLVPRLPGVAGAGKAAPWPPRCPNHPGIGKAAHRPTHALPGRSHRPWASLYVASSDARSPDVQRHHPAGPTTRIVPGTRLVPGRQGSGRNHVPPHPSHADRTSLPPRLPPPLASGPSTYPRTVSAGGSPGHGVLSAPR